ncbi:MAG: ABC transporter substrate-binding protein [Candidatus Nanoarchaeia archaeon]
MKYAVPLIVALLLLTSCASDDSITIGWYGPLSGPAAFLGVNNLNGVKLAVADINAQGGINGKQVKLITEDDQMDPKISVDVFQKMTSVDGVNFILSPSYSGILAASAQAEGNTVLISSLDSSHELADAGDWVFGAGVYDEAIGYVLAEFTKENIGDNAAVLYNVEEAFTSIAKSAFLERFRELNGTAVAYEYTFDTDDFRTVLTKVKESDVDALAIIGYDEAALAFKQAKEIGLKAQLLGIDTATSQNFMDSAGDSIVGMYLTSWVAESESYNAMAEKYKAAYNEEPEVPLSVAVGYDSTMVLAEALKAGTDPETLKNAIYKVKDLEGVTGTLTMSEDGIIRTILEEMYIMKENGVYERVE